jgi:hypothetical protein
MVLPNHLFVSSTDGAMYDTRAPGWASKPLRALNRADIRPGSIRVVRFGGAS